MAALANLKTRLAYPSAESEAVASPIFDDYQKKIMPLASPHDKTAAMTKKQQDAHNYLGNCIEQIISNHNTEQMLMQQCNKLWSITEKAEQLRAEVGKLKTRLAGIEELVTYARTDLVATTTAAQMASDAKKASETTDAQTILKFCRLALFAKTVDA